MLSGLLEDLYRLRVDAGDWDRQRLPEHLRFYCRILDAEGKTIIAGRDFADLQQRLRGQQSAASATAHGCGH